MTKPSRSLSHGRLACCGLVVAGATVPGRRQKLAMPMLAQRRFGPAGDHHVGHVELDESARVADGVRAGRTGGRDGGIWAGDVRRGSRRSRWPALTMSRGTVNGLTRLTPRDRGSVFCSSSVSMPADAAADDHAAAVGSSLVKSTPESFDGADGRGNAELPEAIEALGLADGRCRIW